MTHDERVRFAAGKLNVRVVPVFKEHYFPRIYASDDTACSSDPWVRNKMIEGYVVEGTDERFDLTSPELFLKGLDVYAKDGAPFLLSWWGVKLGTQNMTFEKIEDIPLMFWQCWAELEGGQQP